MWARLVGTMQCSCFVTYDQGTYLYVLYLSFPSKGLTVPKFYVRDRTKRDIVPKGISYQKGYVHVVHERVVFVRTSRGSNKATRTSFVLAFIRRLLWRWENQFILREN